MSTDESQAQKLLFNPWRETVVKRDPPPPAADTDTSRDAAEAITTAAGRLRKMVLDWLTARGSLGATDEEIQEGLMLAGNTARPRRWELQRDRLIVDSGGRRKTASGRAAIVWVAATRKPR